MASTGADISTLPPPQDDVSHLSAAEIWRYFEEYKRSAIFHLKRYLDHRKTIVQEGGTLGSDSLELVLQTRPPASSPVWALKAARDNLKNELDICIRLLDVLYTKSSTRFTMFSLLSVALVATIKLTENGLSTMATVARGINITAVAALSGYLGYKTTCCGSISLCKTVMQRLYQKTVDYTLEETDRNDLEGFKFAVLWWSLLLSVRGD
ncbi:hypothetical protein AYL99_01050 [Fonsecaea erecta]|uniref:Uncharacterized protein n=1 Tax=Fonsecaea erecta TaxID=1367422 RepID=A0A178ZZ22_9EURO|nr:hypothetical protein AYL99_01050 [Fonsecaea erecta]OAP65078.1 hypothetical protein AYL99_01050 [Fonsecaea erecta]